MIDYILFVSAYILAAFCSGSETAISAADRVQIAARGKRGKRALWFIENPSRYLATTLVGTNIGIVLTSSISNRWGTQLGGIWEAAFIFFTAISLLVFSEITPKHLALFRSNFVAVKASPILYFLRVVFYPLIITASFISNLIAGSSNTGRFFESRKEVQGLLQSAGGTRGQLAATVLNLAEMPIRNYSKSLTGFPGIDSKASRAEAIDLLLESDDDFILVWEEFGVTLQGVVESSALMRWDGLGPVSNIAIGLPSVEIKISPLALLSLLWQSGARAAILLDDNQQPEKLVTAESILNHLIPQEE